MDFILPTVNEPNIIAWLEYAGDRTFTHQAGKVLYRDSPLAAWVRHHLSEPAAHFVYLLRLSSGALYVGITRADRCPNRMKAHQRKAQRDVPDSPSAAYLRQDGWSTVEDLRLVPDRIAAWLTEAEWTCALAARGVEVFGNCPGDLCPAKAWCEAPASWGRNWCPASQSRS
jgi:hypothetical protein